MMHFFEIPRSGSGDFAGIDRCGKWQKVSADLSGKKAVGSIGRNYDVVIVRYDFTRYSWVFFA